MENIQIDPELQALIPPLSPDEFAQLQANIIADGCRDPLVVWPHPTYRIELDDGGFGTLNYEDSETCYGEPLHEKDVEHEYSVWIGKFNGVEYEVYEDEWPCTLIDGHNRFEICSRNGIEFKTISLDFPDRAAVEDWMDSNQLGRRNLSPDAFRMILGRRYTRAKKTKAEAGAIGGSSKGQIDPCFKESTAARLSKEHAVSERTVKRAAKFYEEVERAPELKKAVAEGRPVLQVKRELKEKVREARREENRAKISAVPEPEKAFTQLAAKFSTIVIDPPWDWGDEGDQDQLGRARPDYSTISMPQLLDLPVGELADDDAHIYLWITNRSLPKGFALLDRWGFRYITAITWVKPHFGMGNYFRGQTEHILFGVKGSQPLKRKDVGTVFHANRGKGGHSSKPTEFYDFVESCSPGPYVEMFSRGDRADWTHWGENSHAAA